MQSILEDASLALWAFKAESKRLLSVSYYASCPHVLGDFFHYLHSCIYVDFFVAEYISTARFVIDEGASCIVYEQGT